MSDLHHGFRRLPVRRAHALGIIQRKGQRLLLIHMFAGCERINKMLAMQMLRRGDDHGVNGLIVQKPAMVAVDGAQKARGRGVVQALGVNIGKGGDLDIGAGDGLMQQFAAALPGADQADAHAVVGAQHAPGRGGQR